MVFVLGFKCIGCSCFRFELVYRFDVRCYILYILLLYIISYIILFYLLFSSSPIFSSSFPSHLIHLLLLLCSSSPSLPIYLPSLPPHPFQILQEYLSVLTYTYLYSIIPIIFSSFPSLIPFLILSSSFFSNHVSRYLRLGMVCSGVLIYVSRVRVPG